MEGYTITESAERLGMSRQALSKILNRLGIAPIKRGRKKILTTNQLEVITKSLQTNRESRNGTGKVNGNTSDTEGLRVSIDVLREQLAMKDQQIADLNERLRESNVMLNKAIPETHNLLGNDTTPLSGTPRPSFFRRLFQS